MEAALGRHWAWGGLRRWLLRSRQRAGWRAAAQEKQGGNEEGGRRLPVSKLEATGAVASHSTDRRPALQGEAFGSHISQIQL